MGINFREQNSGDNEAEYALEVTIALTIRIEKIFMKGEPVIEKRLYL